MKDYVNFRIFGSKIYPTIFFEYQKKPTYLSTFPKEVKHLRWIFREMPHLRKKRGIFEDIFGKVYTKMDKKYLNLINIALLKAQ